MLKRLVILIPLILLLAGSVAGAPAGPIAAPGAAPDEAPGAVPGAAPDEAHGAVPGAASGAAPDEAHSATAVAPASGFTPGWALLAKKLHFEKDGLFNYIDGAAELFTEFGFNALDVYEYGKDKDTLTLEVYGMESPEAALGFYLMKCGKDLQLQGKESDEESLRYQLPLLRGSYFILINNSHGEKRLIPVMKALGEQIKKNIPAIKEIQPFDSLPREHLVKDSELLFRGPCALQQIFIFGSGDVFQLQGRIFGCAGDYTGDDGSSYTRLIIPYPDKRAALSAYQNLVSNLDSELTVLSKSDNGFTFRDFEKKYGVVKLDDHRLDILIHLSKAPRL